MNSAMKSGITSVLVIMWVASGGPCIAALTRSTRLGAGTAIKNVSYLIFIQPRQTGKVVLTSSARSRSTVTRLALTPWREAVLSPTQTVSQCIRQIHRLSSSAFLKIKLCSIAFPPLDSASGMPMSIKWNRMNTPLTGLSRLLLLSGISVKTKWLR
ncbi:Uncharacterised protein [Escherichia coli]|uniref:Secreted protein n=1 Tax=Escherichia coli TaxID=562 RepID=A0AB38F1A9_ECOLX|nr:Uncharacterised protein [Escherichia coli]